MEKTKDMNLIRTHRTKLMLITVVLLLIPLACNLPTAAVPTPPGQNPTPIDQGPTPTTQPTITPRPLENGSSSSCTYRAQLVSSSLPYGAGLNSAQSFNQTWELKNTGTCPWKEASLQLVTGNSFNSTPGAWDLPDTAPGDTARLSLQFQAPQQAGTYRGDWQMVNGKGHAFGPQVLTVAIQVASSRGASTGAGTGSSGGQSSGGGSSGGGSGNPFPFNPGMIDDILDPLGNAILIPDPKLAAIRTLYPDLSRYVDNNQLPDLSDVDELPLDRFDIDPETLRELAQSDPVQRFLSGSSEDDPQIGKPPKPPKDSEENQPQKEENAYRIEVKGFITVTEAHRGVRRHTKRKTIDYTSIVVDNHHPALYFTKDECVSGTDKRGVYGAATPYFFRQPDGVRILVLHHIHYRNCKTGNKPLFGPLLDIKKYIVDMESGDTHHFETPWNHAGKKGSTKIVLDFKVEGFHREITEDGYITRRQE